MIVRITTHPRQSGILLAHTPPDLAHAMGNFQPARWSPQAKAYLLGEDHLDALRRYLAHHDVQVVDERGRRGDDVEKFTGPLPECSACGQSAGRQAALALVRCPACGAAWRPVVAEAPDHSGWTPKVECSACGGRQRAGWAFCGRCGADMPAAPPPGPRPPEVPRPKLEAPALFGDLVDEVAAGLEPDHMQRAAGDR